MSYPESYPDFNGEFRANFAGVEQPKGLASIPSDWYLARIVDAEFGETSKQSKTPGAKKLLVRFEVASGDYAGRQLVRSYVFSEKMLPFILQLFTASSRFTDEELGGSIGATRMLDVIGAQVIIKVAQERAELFADANGFRNDVKEVRPATDEWAAHRAGLAEVPAGTDPRMP